MSFDTGDLILHKPTRLTYWVACCHDDKWIHTCGPELRLLAADCEIVRAASESERRENMQAMASSTGPGHRPQCARRRLAICAAAALLSGCMSLGVSDMSASQIRATNGMIMCAQVVSMYGKGSSITVNADDVRKGVSARSKTTIVCGDATMTIDSTLKEEKP